MPSPALLEKVLFRINIVPMFLFEMPPPATAAELPEKTQLSTVLEPTLKRPPPKPLPPIAEFPEMVQF